MAPTAARWNVASGLDFLGRGELLEQLLARLPASNSATAARDLVLDGGGGLGAEVARQRLGHVAVLGPEGLVDLRLSRRSATSRARSTNAVSSSRAAFSNSALTKSALAPGLLAVEHAGADLDRVEHQPRGVLAVLLALAREAHGARVVDDEAVDPQARRRACGPGRRGEGWQLP